eukprot:CAMPEP_0202360430 /NCGR_PEP_ID=MMETSP1126-20121109/13372_1 /ASSEMBLY_ACC=CAM_ASM_000457 /TAXON_ID=3047 /ORGANISM="Dunaliella tertiolecta, Strain CCMP1320" /LENGTH=43 /DNA_ID= /DNA_START= /DNA_END= /DNA_ORIENTATION=
MNGFVGVGPQMALTARGDFAAVKLQHRPPHVLRDSIQAPQSAH